MKSNGSVDIEFPLWSKIVGFVVAILIIVLNSIEINMLRKTNNKPFYEKMLLSLTLCDLNSGIFGLIAVSLVSVVKTKSYLILNWTVWGFGVSSSTLTSLLHLIFIGLDRFWSVRKPIQHRQYATKRKLTVAVVLAWGIPLIFLIANIMLILVKELSVEEVYSYIEDTVFIILARVVVIADIFLIISYCKIVWIVIRSKRKSSQMRSSRQNNSFNPIPGGSV